MLSPIARIAGRSGRACKTSIRKAKMGITTVIVTRSEFGELLLQTRGKSHRPIVHSFKENMKRPAPPDIRDEEQDSSGREKYRDRQRTDSHTAYHGHVGGAWGVIRDRDMRRTQLRRVCGNEQNVATGCGD